MLLSLYFFSQELASPYTAYNIQINFQSLHILMPLFPSNFITRYSPTKSLRYSPTHLLKPHYLLPLHPSAHAVSPGIHSSFPLSKFHSSKPSMTMFCALNSHYIQLFLQSNHCQVWALQRVPKNPMNLYV